MSLSDQSTVITIIAAVTTQVKPTFGFCNNVLAKKDD
jgi:hypothetical protein